MTQNQFRRKGTAKVGVSSIGKSDFSESLHNVESAQCFFEAIYYFILGKLYIQTKCCLPLQKNYFVVNLANILSV